MQTLHTKEKQQGTSYLKYMYIFLIRIKLSFLGKDPLVATLSCVSQQTPTLLDSASPNFHRESKQNLLECFK